MPFARIFTPTIVALAVLTAMPAMAVDRFVTNKTQFTATMAVVQPGDVIIWKNGTNDNQGTISFEPTTDGTAALPITLRAETPGGVVFRGTSQLQLGGHFLVVSGFRFDNTGFSFADSSTAVWVIQTRAHSDLARHAYNCRVTDCAIVNYDNPAATSSSKWLEWYGATNRFDHNLVTGKRTQGAVFIVELSDQTNNIEAHHNIDHNVFADRTPGPLGNEYETVRVGTSSVSDENAHVTVESNYFYRCSGEAEFVSNKSCENTYRYNTFVECAGSLTLRHGRGCLVEGNIFLGNNVTNSGGIRVVNQDHVIINNYLQDLAGTDYQAAIAVMDGTTWTPPAASPDLSGSYVQVKNVLIAHNTIVNAADAVNYGVGKGGSGRTTPPREFTMAANIIVSTNAPIFTLTDTPINLTNLNNIVWGTNTGLAANPELVVTNPLLTADALGFYRPATNSPAAGAAGTEFLLPSDLLDMDGSLRPLAGRDIGADEIGLGLRPVAPLTASEVGPTWMQPAGLNPNLPPGGNFDLSHWKLTLPIDNAGTNSGDAIEKSAAQLVAGYTNALYFYTGADGAMGFWCPVNGATTSGSSFPRSELREMLNPSDDNINWTAYGTHTLDAQCKVTQIPSTKKVIIGQIHSFSGAARPLIKLQCNDGVIEALVKNSPNADTDTKYTFQNVGLSNSVAYQIKVTDGLLSLTVNNSNQTVNFFQTDPDWTNQTFYFKAGSYCQDNSGPSDEGSLVAFYALTVGHNTNVPPVITVQPASQTNFVGSNVTFNVSASGSAPLRYQWWFAATNKLTGATNTSLTLTNIQTTNAGGYTVVVTNQYGAVTSAVATLTVVVVSNSPPFITTQPTNAAVVEGQTAAFSVVAGGTLPLNYQWFFNTNTWLTNATNATLTLSSVQSNNAGGYNVIVTNLFGSATSVVATLTVNPAPPISTNGFRWDANTNAVGIQDGAGIWKTASVTNSFWTTNGGVNNVAWPASNVVASAIFGGGESGTAGMVTLVDALAAAPRVDAITFNVPFVGDYVLTNASGAAGPVLSDGATITVNGGAPSIKSPMSGTTATAGFKKKGGGVLVLGAANTFSGIVTVSDGVLVIGADGALGANPAALVSDQLTLDGGTLRITNDVTWGTRRGISLTTNGGTIEVIAGKTLTMAGSSSAPECISGAVGGDLIKTGGGTFSINLNNPNSYAGQTIVNEGTLLLNGNNAIIAIGVGGLTINTNATFIIAASKSALISNGAPVTNRGGTFIAGGTETNRFLLLGGNGIITNGSTSSRTFVVNDQITLESGTIVGNGSPAPIDKMILAGTASLVKTTPGTVYLVGTNSTQVGNTFTSKTTISDGVLSVGLDAALGANPGTFTPDQLTFDGGALQIMSAYAWGSKRGITLTANGGAFDILAGVNQTLPLAIGGASGGDLNKLGNGTLTLTGTNSYDGDTVVSNGVLALGAMGKIANSPVIRVASGATLDVSAAGLSLGATQTLAGSGTVTGNVVMNSGAKVQPGVGAAKLTVTGNLSLNNNVVAVDLGGATLGAGTYRVMDYSGSKTGAFQASPTLLNGSTTGMATIDQSTTNQINLIVGSAPPTLPSFGSVVLAGANLIMSGSGGATGATYYVLGSTNIALPVGSWARVATNAFDGNGNFSFTNVVSSGQSRQFFLIAVP